LQLALWAEKDLEILAASGKRGQRNEGEISLWKLSYSGWLTLTQNQNINVDVGCIKDMSWEMRLA